MIKRALLLLVMLLCLCTAAAAETTTLIMYMCGSNLQDQCLTDMQEMLDANTGEDINIVILAGGSVSWSYERLQGDRLNLLTLGGGKVGPVEDWGKASMGDPATLEKYLNYALDHYPADKTMLVFWNHGGGSEGGVCYDAVFENDHLTLKDIEQVLESLKTKRNNHFDIVGFDACLMAGYETAAMLMPYADYMVASEELEPGLGWYYTGWLSALDRNPDMAPADIGREIISAYQNACEEDDPDSYYTLSLLDLKEMPAFVEQMEQLSSYLAGALENRQLKTISRLRHRTKSYGYWHNSSSDMIDMTALLDICKVFVPEATEQAKAALAKVVLNNYRSHMVEQADGMSVYVPKDTRKNTRDLMGGYTIAAIPNYQDFVLGYADLLNGGDYHFAAAAAVSVETNNEDLLNSFSTIGLLPGIEFSLDGATAFIASHGHTDASQEQSQATPAPAEPFLDQAQLQAAISFIVAHGGQPAVSASAFLTQEQIQAAIGFIAAHNGSGADAAQDVVSAGSSFIAAHTTAEEPEVNEDSHAFALTLSADAMENLSYAEGALFMDVSDEDGVYLVDLGYSRNTWIDWQNNTVYSLFDDTWPILDQQLVPLYEQSRTETASRCLIPVRVNGEETYLVVVFSNGSKEGKILGYNAGYDEDGLAIRDITPLQEGDRVVPVYTMYYCSREELDNDEEMQETEFDGDEIIWHDGVTISFEDVDEDDDDDEPITFQFAFYLNDIFGECELSEMTEFTM